MSAPMEELARRLVAAPGWRWMPGMVDTKGRRVVETHTSGVPCEWASESRCQVYDYYEDPAGAEDCWRGALPDLSDPATVGCLRALVEHGGRLAIVLRVIVRVADGGVVRWWRLERMASDRQVSMGVPTMPFLVDSRSIGGPTLVEALVDAMLHAPAVSP